MTEVLDTHNRFYSLLYCIIIGLR